MIVAPSADLELAVRVDRLRRRRHLRPALHDAAAADRARVDRRRTAAIGCSRSTRDCRSAIRRRDGTLVGPLIDEARVRRDGGGARRPRAQQGGSVHGGGRVTDGVPAGGFYVRPAIVEIDAERADRAAGDLRADSLRACAIARFDEAIAHSQRRAARAVVGDLHQRRARGRAVLLGRPAPTAASPTSTSAPAARRSAARSAAKRKPAAAANRAPTPGRPTCAAPPTRSTTRTTAAGAGHQVRRRP